MQTLLKPSFTRETAFLKVKAAEDAWNRRSAILNQTLNTKMVRV
ncbi:DUF1348 family protein [Ktedonosporobacter rubrisoli]|uniref:DUF1348 family protein n=1 Tax=Ktedonosporobacter rubrisoli TaxID=2509675 RepID=A0A4P6K6F5_KTERU|nr:DUF1348 family protein [Ktedonosporobacter rubrisoli]